jgi:hypothetical protein
MCGKKVRELTLENYVHALMRQSRYFKGMLYNWLRRELGITSFADVPDDLRGMSLKEKKETYERLKKELIEAFESDGEGV